MIMAKDEQPGAEVCRAGSERVSSAGASVAVELGCIILHEQGCVHQPESSLKAMLPEFLWRLHHVGMVNYYLHF